MKPRAVISSLLLLAFVVVFISGIGLMKAPSGRIARETNWEFLGFDKTRLEQLHTLLGNFDGLLVAVHFIIYKMCSAEIKSLGR